MNESSLISAILEGIPQQEPHHRVQDLDLTVTVGAAARDDCFVAELRGECDLVASTDYVRGPKFKLFELGHLSFYDLGYYLAIANLSDVASMGAEPLGLLSVIRYTSSMSETEFVECANGIADAAAAHGTLPLGGDVGTAERLILTATAMGVCEKGRALRRSSGRASDQVFVTGRIGRAAAAIQYFTARDRDEIPPLERALEEDLLDAWRRPVAHFAEGRHFTRSDVPAACQDVSDGLKATIQQMARASGVGVEIWQDRLPIPDCVHAVAEALQLNSVSLALGASVDFELLFFVPEGSTHLADELRLSHIGECNDSHTTTIVTEDGRVTPLPGVAWEQQFGDVAAIVAEGSKK